MQSVPGTSPATILDWGGGGCVGDDDWFGVVVMVSEMPLAVSCGG